MLQPVMLIKKDSNLTPSLPSDITHTQTHNGGNVCVFRFFRSMVQYREYVKIMFYVHHKT